MKNLRVVHDIEGHVFYAKVKGGMAKLSYDRYGDSYVDYKYTYVPQESRHYGIASTMAEHAMNFAVDLNLRVKPTCPFVQDFIARNPEFKRLAFTPEPT